MGGNLGHPNIVYLAEMNKSCALQIFEEEKLAGRGNAVKKFEDEWKWVLGENRLAWSIFPLTYIRAPLFFILVRPYTEKISVADSLEKIEHKLYKRSATHFLKGQSREQT